MWFRTSLSPFYLLTCLTPTSAFHFLLHTILSFSLPPSLTLFLELFFFFFSLSVSRISLWCRLWPCSQSVPLLIFFTPIAARLLSLLRFVTVSFSSISSACIVNRSGLVGNSELRSLGLFLHWFQIARLWSKRCSIFNVPISPPMSHLLILISNRRSGFHLLTLCFVIKFFEHNCYSEAVAF